jgi:hypothetical protein
VTPLDVLFLVGVGCLVLFVLGWFGDRYDERADARERNRRR